MSLASPNRGYPLERITGDVGTMSRWVDQFEVVAEHLTALRGAAARTSGCAGVGKAVSGARKDAVAILSVIGPDVALAQTLGEALSAYAQAHDAHAQKANALIEEIESAHTRFETLGRAADSAGRGALAASRLDDPVALEKAQDEATEQIGARDRAEDELNELWLEYERHFGAWEEAYDAAVRALVPSESVPVTLEARDFLDALLSADTPEEVLRLWLSRPELQDEVINAHPEIVGAMDGIPALVRVAANRLNAPGWIAEAEADLAVEGISDERAAFLRSEIAYLRQVMSDDDPVQLYLYDRDSSRIIEMIGTPSPETEKVITYVPGTFTSLGDFYTGGAQQIAGYLADQVPGTVAFVYKDGPFPGENPDVGGIDMFRIGEANDPDRALAAGQQLARFQAGMRADPLLGTAEHDAFGHSWGLANVTSSEVAGAHYDKVISLSGAGMLDAWKPSRDTSYTDLSYNDILQSGQGLGLVWGGNNPREHPAFEHGEYYEGPHDDQLADSASVPSSGYPAVYVPLDDIGVLMDNHNLIATTATANDKALNEMLNLVIGR